MKKHIILPLLILLVGLSACKLNEQNNSSPALSLYGYAKINSDSTVAIKYADEGRTSAKLDSVHVADSVLVHVIMNGITNNLTSFQLTSTDTTSIKMLLPDNLDAVFTTGSNYKEGKFIFKNEIGYLSYPLRFVVLKPINEFKFTFKVTSDATGVPNEVGFGLVFPIKPKLTTTK